MKENEFLKELEKNNISITQEQIDKLNKYKKYLQEQNKLYNLTALITDEDIYLKHFYDSIIISKYYDFKRIESLADIGTGAGFPGVVLKIFFPDLKIFLVDSNNKKIKFLNDVIKMLDLKNITAVHSRIEEVSIKTDIVIARAVGNISYLAELSYNVYQISKNLLDNLNLKIKKQEEYLLPITEDIRNIIVFKKEKHNNKYPRKYTLIKKQVL